MNSKKIKVQAGGIGLLLLLAAMACSLLPVASTGEVQTETQSVDLGGASAANVRIEMDAGKLSVGGGADSLMEATFRYNVDDWRAQVSYSVNGGVGELVVNQPEKDNRLAAPDVVNEWDLRLNEAVPLTIQILTGAGQSTLDLSALDFSDLSVEIGAGEITLDLSGSWDHDVTATITGGVGSVTVTLPDEMGVRVTSESGLGNVTATGLTRDGGGYVNPAFGSAPYSLTLEIQTGVGSIELVAP